MKTLRVAVFGMALSVALPALAQSSVGEVLDKGGKQLSRTEIVGRMQDGKKFTASTRSGSSLDLAMKTDKSFNGSASSPMGSTPVFGNWDVDDSGKICLNYTLVALQRQDQTCLYQYVLGDERYVARGSDRADPVSKNAFD